MNLTEQARRPRTKLGPEVRNDIEIRLPSVLAARAKQINFYVSLRISFCDSLDCELNNFRRHFFEVCHGFTSASM
jgi:hypothetical protein